VKKRLFPELIVLGPHGANASLERDKAKITQRKFSELTWHGGSYIRTDMGLRQRQWAKKRREMLMRILGNRCAKCGSDQELEFDCVSPKGHAHHEYEQSWRMSFYLAQFHDDNLQILCAPCNRVKGNTFADYRTRTHDDTTTHSEH